MTEPRTPSAMLVSRLLAAIDEVERPELDARGDHHLSWQLFADSADKVEASCHYCDWTATGLEQEVNPLADEHARRCVSMPISPVLRLCQAHRDIVAGHPAVEDRYGWGSNEPGGYGEINPACGSCGSEDLATRWPCATILALARGHGVEDGETK